MVATTAAFETGSRVVTVAVGDHRPAPTGRTGSM